ncbi:hypothetical protein BGW36DRAFT_432342 [Talaromyces proteolyticus]|uniref:Rhodopsin domain-containing protein n=1 Tax=Talaromyces proteolyticus TaxID=1131652 RepID=A0AAD4KHI0_9EURO|nr:uncharacterized protein BGW36DRAFT_432342 [Talaromyces proteolyticus]KAH8690544.1 hypothetical protein BGW36DRAFT_432342 [Talaromyces proteolyticus]
MSSAKQPSPGFLEEDKRPTIWGVCAVFLALNTLSTVLRLISRRVNGIKWGWGEYLTLLGYVLITAMIGCSLADVKFGGVGLHAERVKQINPEMLVTWGKYVLIIPLIYLAAVVPPKLAILDLYLNIFISQTARIICYVTAGAVVANWAAATIAGFVSCIPLDHLWDPARSPHGHCFDTNAWFRWSSLVNMITDVIVMVLPVPTVLQLQCSFRMKLGIMFTFAMGSLGLVASILRFVTFFNTNAVADPTWSASTLIIWTNVEAGVYLIACCLPTYRPLARFIWHRSGLATKVKRSRDGTNSNPGLNTDSRIGYELSQSSNFIRLKGSKDVDDESIGLVLEERH